MKMNKELMIEMLQVYLEYQKNLTTLIELSEMVEPHFSVGKKEEEEADDSLLGHSAFMPSLLEVCKDKEVKLFEEEPKMTSLPDSAQIEGYVDLDCAKSTTIETSYEDKDISDDSLKNGEDMQVLKYEHGQKYDAHFDFFQDNVNTVRGGHRTATVLMYLSDVREGGETVFPSAEVDSRHRINTKDDTLSDCAKKGVAVKPKKGDALLFFSLTPGAMTDSLSLHAGCPVIEGEKWSATKWIHVKSFDKTTQSSERCLDEHDRCGEWAAYGECVNNPEYMVGTTDLPGVCRKSCKVC